MKFIEINGKSFKVKYTIRALFIFEQITNKSFEIKTTLDNYVFFYSMLVANNPDTSLEWDEYLDALDNDPTLFQKLTEITTESEKKNDLLSNEEDDKKGKGKGKKKSA